MEGVVGGKAVSALGKGGEHKASMFREAFW